MVGIDIFMTDGKTLLFALDFHSKFQIVKEVNCL